MKSKNPLLIDNEHGMVSIIVTLILMVVITVIVLGVSQISRREQRQALDRQLSTQAFYAAESGVNDAVDAINSGTYTLNKTTCDNTGTPFLGQNVIDAANNVSYSCLLIDQSPDSLQYTVPSNNSISADMQFSNGAGPVNATSITISWTTASSNLYPNFPSLGPWSGTTSLLRLAATDLSGANPYKRGNLNNNTFTTYLYPSDGSGAPGSNTISFTPTVSDIKAQGQIVKATCSAGSCTATITFGALGIKHVFFRLGALYTSTVVTIKASNGSILKITGTQAVIDSTGKAQDVLRRVQVHLPLRQFDDVPSFALQSVKGLCKQLAVNKFDVTTIYSLYGGCTYP